MADKDMSEEKAARLAAIRAANAAKQGGQEAAPAQESEKPATSMSDDKAARLAAIRAANTAKQGTETAAAPTQKISTQPATANKSVSDDKAARLAAIRAANASKSADSGTAAPTTPAAPAPAAAKPTPAAKPAPAKASAATKGDASTPSSQPMTMAGVAIRIVVGAVVGAVVLLLFSTTTMHYQSMELATAFGAVFGAIAAYIAGLWPPSPGDEVSE